MLMAPAFCSVCILVILLSGEHRRVVLHLSASASQHCSHVLPGPQLLHEQSWRLSAGTPSTSEELLRLPCDVLILASVTGIITAENAPELQCKAWPFCLLSSATYKPKLVDLAKKSC